MAKEKIKLRWQRIAIISAAIVLVLAVFYLLKLNFGDYLSQIWDAFKVVLIPAAIALFIVYLIAPINRAFKRKGLSKNLAAIASIAIFSIIFLGFLGLIVFLVTEQVLNIVPIIKNNWDNIIATISGITGNMPDINIITPDNRFDWSGIAKLLFGETGGGSIIFSKTLNGITLAAYWLVMIIMMPVFLFFFLKEGDRIFAAAIKVVPSKWHKDDIEIVMKLANSSTEKYIRGKLISILALFLFFGTGFAITFVVLGKLPVMTAILYGILFGGILALLDLIPYIGPTVGVVLPIFFLLIITGFTEKFIIFGIVLLIINLLGQNLQKILFEPVIMSKEVDLHPLAVFIGLLFFGSLFGFVGMILATPIVATIRSVYNYLVGKYSEEIIESIIDEDITLPTKHDVQEVKVTEEIKEEKIEKEG